MRRERALNGGVAPAGELALEVDRADLVLAGELGEHLAHDALDVALLMAEVVVERLQRSVRDLQLRGGELEGEGRLVGADEVGFVRHGPTLQRRGAPARDPTVVIAVCLAVHRPQPARLERQLASLDAQRDVEWALMREDDEQGSGPWRAFERCYGRVSREADLVAPCDQDDVWHPAKLATLSAALGDGATLAFCDLRIVDGTGAVVSPTYWTDRVATWDDLGAELQTNVVTGAACLVRREVLDVALPFPAELDGSFHDHWLAVCALALGELAYVDRALVDYVQHDANVVGWSPRRRPGARSRGGNRPRGGPRAARAGRDGERHLERPRLWARTLLERAPHIAPRKRRALERAARAGPPPPGGRAPRGTPGA